MNHGGGLPCSHRGDGAADTGTFGLVEVQGIMPRLFDHLETLVVVDDPWSYSLHASDYR